MSKDETYKVEHLTWLQLVLPANIRLEWKFMATKHELAYNTSTPKYTNIYEQGWDLYNVEHLSDLQF